ncbi:MAG: hypothetical protein QMD71_03660 [bacterium]|nr:hypothetical protein [bacterium]
MNIKYLIPYCIGVLLLLSLLLITGCEQKPLDTDNAVVSAYIYEYAVPTDSVFVDSVWEYTKWDFYNPVESVQVFVEPDIASAIPYRGPDIIGYTDSTGLFSIPVYLGHTQCGSSYEYVYYADVRVLCVYKGGKYYDYGGGITLARGKEFRLWPIALMWFAGE